MNFNLLNEYAQELSGFGQKWSGWQFSVFPEFPQEMKGVKVTGACCPLRTRGPKKGLANLRRADKSTRREFYILKEEYEAWVKVWEQKNGKCANCEGKGEEFASWSATESTKTRTCTVCKGTGKPTTHE